MPDSIRQLLGDARTHLRAVSTSPRLDAELLLAHVLNWPRSRLYARPEDHLPATERQRFRDLLAARAQGRPMAYLLGQQEFWSLPLELGEDCLVPRPETEMLVEFALALPDNTLEVLDLGSGSGAIAIAVKHERPLWQVCAVERDAKALTWARRNAQTHACAIEWRHGDWFAPLDGRRFDLILSNPPYIAATDPHLQALRFEPQQALIAGADGLDDLRKIIAAAPAHLKPAGHLALEHGMDQGAAVRQLLQDAGFVEVHSRADLAGLERISCGRKPA